MLPNNINVTSESLFEHLFKTLSFLYGYYVNAYQRECQPVVSNYFIGRQQISAPEWLLFMKTCNMKIKQFYE